MKRITTALFICLAALPTALLAQKIKLLQSSEQSWSGGVAGHMGENYSFTIEFDNCKKQLQPDTLWIGQEPIILSETNARQTHTKKGITLQINAGTSRNDYADRYPQPGKEQKRESHSPYKYHGVALLSYRYGNEQCFYEISRFITRLPPISYP